MKMRVIDELYLDISKTTEVSTETEKKLAGILGDLLTLTKTYETGNPELQKIRRRARDAIEDVEGRLK